MTSNFQKITLEGVYVDDIREGIEEQKLGMRYNPETKTIEFDKDTHVAEAKSNHQKS